MKESGVFVGEVVARGRRSREQAARDVAMLGWIGRFRFVTAAELSARFETSEQRVNARVRRFIAAGLVAEHREHVSQARAIFLTAAGAHAIGQPPRKPPRADTQRRHELAVVQLAVGLELEGRTVHTERECRQAERHDPGRRRWSVDVRGRQRRWPDLVLEREDGGRCAVELELAIKHTRRLVDIVTAYRASVAFEEVRWIVEHPRHLERLRAMLKTAGRPSELHKLLGTGATVQTAELWTRRPS